MKALIAALALASNVAMADEYGYTAKLPDGNTLKVLQRSKDCGDKPVALLLDQHMTDLAHTCEIEPSSSGVSVTFEGKPTIFVPTGQLDLIGMPPDYSHEEY